jgi:hypothetical protein
MDGLGTIEDLSGARTIDLRPGGLYSAVIGEPHVVTATTAMTLISVFDPPLHGTEEAD